MRIASNSGGEMGAHGWLAALDLHTGRQLWRAYATGPGSLLRIEATYQPFYDWMRRPNSGTRQAQQPHGGQH
jgi:hypothetical protein